MRLSEPAPGQRPSIEGLIPISRGYARRSAKRLGLPGCDRDDVAQNVVIAVARCLDAYDPERPLRPWIKTIAYRMARDQRSLARYEREELSSASLEVADAAPDPEARLIARQTLRRALDLLDALHPEIRIVFVMHVLDDLPVAEIASALAILPSTANTRLQRARAELRAAWARAEARRRGGARRPTT
jgi:RNA polymerase sigma-70 factor, ECF subfamily